MALIKNMIRKRTNNTFAIPAALAAIPLNPKIPAMSARTRNVIDQVSMLALLERFVLIGKDS